MRDESPVDGWLRGTIAIREFQGCISLPTEIPVSIAERSRGGCRLDICGLLNVTGKCSGLLAK